MVNVQQEYVECASGGLVTETVNGNWLQAYCEFLGITEPSNSSWLQALCEHFGITQPLYGSWTIALANYYGITQPGEYGTWWNAIQDTVCTTPPVTGCEWGSAQATFGQDSRIWSSTSPCTIPPTNENWEVVTRNWEVEPDNWEAI
jgi:hypothetical protein